MKTLLKKYLNKNMVLVLWKNRNDVFFLDCRLMQIGADGIFVSTLTNNQVIPFSSIIRIEMEK